MCKRCAKLDWAGVDKVKPKVRFKTWVGVCPRGFGIKGFGPGFDNKVSKISNLK